MRLALAGVQGAEPPGLPQARPPGRHDRISPAQEIFNDSFGPEAPAAAQALGAQLRKRVTFGWAGLREQLLCEEYGIDSVTLELTKLALIGAGEAASLSEHASLRLIDRTSDGRLVLAWLSDEAESGNKTIEVPMDILDAIADDQAWDTARLELTSGFFVDIMKLFVEPELAVPD